MVFIIMLIIFVPLTPMVRSFAIIAAISMLGMLTMMFVWLIAEGINLGYGSDSTGWLKNQWNTMMGRDESMRRDE